MERKTIRRTVTVSGTNVWRRERAALTLAPALPDSGIVINGIPAVTRYAWSFEHSTCLRRGRVHIKMIEHLLAACAGLGITDVAVTLDSDELPLLDGSSLPFVRAIRRAGMTDSGVAARPLVLIRPVMVEGPRGFAAAVPAAHVRLTALIDPPAVPEPQVFSSPITPAVFARAIAPARTFGPSPDSPAETRRALGLPFALRRWNGLLFPARPRLPQEPCRHKLLDLLGDLALLGRPLCAEVFAFRPGHRQNLALARAIEREMEN